MEHKKINKKVGVIFGLKKEMLLFSPNSENILFCYGFSKYSKKATQKILKKNIDLIFNFGFAGSISDDFQNGDVVLVKNIFYKKNMLTAQRPEQKILRKLERLNFKQCNLLTVDKIITEESEKKLIIQKFKEVSIIDMEGFFIKEESYKKKIPMVSIKVIFDDTSFQIPNFLKSCINDKGTIMYTKLAIKILSNPSRLFYLFELKQKYSKSEKILKNLIFSLLT